MKLASIWILLSVLISSGSTLRGEDAWITNYQKALEVSKERKLPIIAFFSAKWCAPCLSFKKRVLDTKEFQDWASTRFVLLQLMDAASAPDKEAEEMQMLWEKYKVISIPFVAVLDSEGNLKRQMSTVFTTATQFQEALSE